MINAGGFSARRFWTLFITPTEIRKSFVWWDSVGKSIQLIVW